MARGDELRYTLDKRNACAADGLYINEHALNHGLTKEQIVHAWEHPLALRYRDAPNEGEAIVVGYEQKGRFIQMVAVMKPYGTLIYHALMPPTEKALKELGLGRR